MGRIIASRDELKNAEMVNDYLKIVIANGHVEANGEIPSISYVYAVQGTNEAGGWVTWRSIPHSQWKVIVQQNANQMGGLFEGVIVIFLLVTIVVSLLGIMGIRQYFSLLATSEKMGKNGTNPDQNMIKFGTMQHQKIRQGFSQITVALAAAVAGIVVIGLTIFLNYGTEKKVYTTQGIDVPVWDQKLLASVKVDMPVLGAVQLSDGSFSAFKLRSAQIKDGKYENEARYFFPNGDDGLGIGENKISNFYTAKGEVYEAKVVEPAIVTIALPDGREYPARVVGGRVSENRLVSNVQLQLYSPNLIFNARIEENATEGMKLKDIKLVGEGERISDIAYILAKQVIAFRKKVAWNASPTVAQVLGVSDSTNYFYDDLASVDYSSDSFTWRVGGVTGLSSTPIIKSSDSALKVSYENGIVQIGLAQTIQNNSFNTNTVVDKSLSGIDIADSSITTLQLALDSVVSSTIKDGEVKTQDIANGAVNIDKLADGTIVTSKLVDGAVSNAKLSQITESEKVAGSAIQLKNGGGLINSNGLSLKNTCTADQVLAWDGDSWECADVATGSGSGDITAVVAGQGLSRALRDSLYNPSGDYGRSH